MTPVEELFKRSFNLDFDPIVKFAFVIFLVGYSVYAVLVVRQVNLMVHVLGTNLSPILKAFAWLHLLVAVTILLIALVV